jgi:hypothetical protein
LETNGDKTFSILIPHACYMSRLSDLPPSLTYVLQNFAQKYAAGDGQIGSVCCHLLTSGAARGTNFSEDKCFNGGFTGIKTVERTHKPLKKDSFFSAGDTACGTHAPPQGRRVYNFLQQLPESRISIINNFCRPQYRLTY